MSIEDLKAFGKKIAEDETVREKAKKIGFNPKEIIEYGKELGLEFDEEDMKALAEEAGFKEDELTQEQLEKIAGGVITTTIAVIGVAGVTAAGALGVAGLAGAGLAGVVGVGVGAGLAGVASAGVAAVIDANDW